MNVMKVFRLFLMLPLVVSSIFHITPAYGGFEDLLKGVQKAVGLGGGVSETKVVDGLKEALHIGTENAVKIVSQVGGYSDNPAIRIPLPKPVKKVETALRMVGYGKQLDAFEMSMNRAAETAAPKAKAIFWDAIKGMNISDARKILQGRDNEATLYFKDKTYGRLNEIFKPIVHEAMSQVGVTRRYQELEAKVGSIPFTENLGFDLDEYVDKGALEGLFYMLAQEEKKIRHDPAARVTDLLKEVFGGH
jgi:hypothetical protein